MAQNYTSVLAELGQTLYPKVISQMNRANVLAALLTDRKPVDSRVGWDIRTGTETPTTASIADGADVTVFNDDTKTKASLEYGTYHDAFRLTDKQLAAAQVAMNPAGLADYFSAAFLESIERLSRAIAYDAIFGTGAADTIHGLLAAGAPAIGATGVYAGIDRASVVQFRGNALAVAATPALSASILRQADTLVYNASGGRCDVWLVNPINHNQYGDSLGGNRRYVQDVFSNDGRQIKLDGGYRTLEFDGSAVIMEKLIPAGTAIGIDTSSMYWSQLLPPADMNTLLQIGGSEMLGAGPSTAERQLNGRRTPLVAYLKRLSNGGNANRFANYAYPQLAVERPNRNVVITGLLAT